MSKVVRGARSRWRVPGAALVAGVATISVVLTAVPAAALSAQRSLPMPGRTAASHPVQHVVAAPAPQVLMAGDVFGQTRGAVGRTGDPVTVTLLGSGPPESQLAYSAAQPATGTVAIVGDQLTYTPADGTSGNPSFAYTVTDAEGHTATGTVQITVTADRIPSTPDEEASTRGATSRLGDPVTIPLAVSDPEGDGLTWWVEDPEHGSAVIEAPGSANPAGPTITYIPDRDHAGTEEFSYSATDTYGGVGTGTITVTVKQNSPPTAPHLSASTRSSTSRTGLPVRVGLASADADADPISYVLSTVTGGSATLDQSGAAQRVVFTPAIGYVGTATVAYTAGDGYGPAASGTIAVTVSANTAPVASGVSATVKGSTTRTGDVAVLDLSATDPDDSPPAAGQCDGSADPAGLCYQLLDQPTTAQGTAELVDAQLTFVPKAGFSGTVALRYRVTDALGATATAGAAIVVQPNEPPTTPAASATTQGSTTRTGDPVVVALPASDPDGIASQAAASTTKGTVVVNGSSLTYTPRSGTSGTDTVSYTATDGRGATNTGTLTVSILANSPPVGTTNAATTVFGRPIAIPLTATDKQGDALTFLPGSAADHGSVSYQGALVTYRPDLTVGKHQSDTDSFSYTVRDGRGAVSPATTVTVSVNPNTAPVAASAAAQTRGGTAGVTGRPVTLPLSATDAEGDHPLTFALDGQPDNGTVALLPSGTDLTYTPDPDFVGTETITYRVTDRVVVGGVERPELEATTIATAKVTVTANRAPSAPTAQLETIGSTTGPGTRVSGILGSVDPDGDAVGFAVGFVPAETGEATLTPTGTFSFTPAGSFTGPAVVPYYVTDALGARTSGVVVIDVMANRVPTVRPATARTRGGTTVAGRPVVIALASQISDPDGDALTVSATAGSGTVTVSGTTLTYVPRAGYSGTDTIKYQAADSRGGSAQSTVAVTVVTNRPPTLAPGARQMPAGGKVVLGLNGADAEGDALTYSLGRAPLRGTATLSGRLLTYTAPRYFAGSVAVPTRVTDAFGATAVSSMTYTVRGVSSFSRIAGVGKAVSGTRPKFAITVRATTGSVNGGLVTITSSGRMIGTGRTAANGTVTITSRVNFSKGTHPLTVRFGGTATTGSATAGSRVPVS